MRKAKKEGGIETVYSTVIFLKYPQKYLYFKYPQKIFLQRKEYTNLKLKF